MLAKTNVGTCSFPNPLRSNRDSASEHHSLAFDCTMGRGRSDRAGLGSLASVGRTVREPVGCWQSRLARRHGAEQAVHPASEPIIRRHRSGADVGRRRRPAPGRHARSIRTLARPSEAVECRRKRHARLPARVRDTARATAAVEDRDQHARALQRMRFPLPLVLHHKSGTTPRRVSGAMDSLVPSCAGSPLDLAPPRPAHRLGGSAIRFDGMCDLRVSSVRISTLRAGRDR